MKRHINIQMVAAALISAFFSAAALANTPGSYDKKNRICGRTAQNIVDTLLVNSGQALMSYTLPQSVDGEFPELLNFSMFVHSASGDGTKKAQINLVLKKGTCAVLSADFYPVE